MCLRNNKSYSDKQMLSTNICLRNNKGYSDKAIKSTDGKREKHQSNKRFAKSCDQEIKDTVAWLFKDEVERKERHSGMIVKTADDLYEGATICMRGFARGIEDNIRHEERHISLWGVYWMRVPVTGHFSFSSEKTTRVLVWMRALVTFRFLPAREWTEPLAQLSTHPERQHPSGVLRLREAAFAVFFESSGRNVMRLRERYVFQSSGRNVMRGFTRGISHKANTQNSRKTQTQHFLTT